MYYYLQQRLVRSNEQGTRLLDQIKDVRLKNIRLEAFDCFTNDMMSIDSIDEWLNYKISDFVQKHFDFIGMRWSFHSNAKLTKSQCIAGVLSGPMLCLLDSLYYWGMGHHDGFTVDTASLSEAKMYGFNHFNTIAINNNKDKTIYVIFDTTPCEVPKKNK